MARGGGPRSREAPTRRGKAEQKPHTSAAGMRASLRARIGRWTEASLERMDEADLLRVAAAQSGAETIAELLATDVGHEQEPDDWSELLLRGAAAKREVARFVGGLLTSTQAAQVAGISVQGIKQRMQRQQMLAVPLGGSQWGFPALQFDQTGQVRAGVAEIAAAMNDADMDPWTLLSILADQVDGVYGEEDGRTLLEAVSEPAVLRDVLRRIATHGEHGAA